MKISSKSNISFWFVFDPLIPSVDVECPRALLLLYTYIHLTSYCSAHPHVLTSLLTPRVPPFFTLFMFQLQLFTLSSSFSTFIYMLFGSFGIISPNTTSLVSCSSLPNALLGQLISMRGIGIWILRCTELSRRLLWRLCDSFCYMEAKVQRHGRKSLHTTSQ
jgi:hypothetical protein